MYFYVFLRRILAIFVYFVLRTEIRVRSRILLTLSPVYENKYQMKYRVKLPPIILYQIDLEHMIRSHRSLDLSLHDKINAVVDQHSWYGMNMCVYT